MEAETSDNPEEFLSYTQGHAVKVAVLDVWMPTTKDRYEDIRNIERYLMGNGVVIRKFFLHVSAEEQTGSSRQTIPVSVPSGRNILHTSTTA